MGDKLLSSGSPCINIITGEASLQTTLGAHDVSRDFRNERKKENIVEFLANNLYWLTAHMKSREF